MAPDKRHGTMYGNDEARRTLNVAVASWRVAYRSSTVFGKRVSKKSILKYALHGFFAMTCR